MLVGITMCSILTGHMATSFDESSSRMTASIKTTADLAGLRVCGYASTFRSWYMPDSIGHIPVVAQNVDECGELLRARAVDAILMEHTTLTYYWNTNNWAQSADLVASDVLAHMPLGVMYPEGSALRATLDERFIKLFETPSLRTFQQRWFSERRTVGASRMNEVQWELVIPTLIMLLLYFGAKSVQRFACKRASQVQQTAKASEQDFRSNHPAWAPGTVNLSA
eukprot:SAG31_NODE_5141_length_2718_cov_2.346315_1_plen_224_part_00